MFSSIIKKYCIKACPKKLQNPALMVVRKCRGLRYRLDMIISPRLMSAFCPCCGLRFRTFATGHYRNTPIRFNPSRYEETRQDVICPVCKSFPRHRILASWCENHRMILRVSNILYFAPEYSMKLWMKRNGVKCTTADLYNEADIKLDIQATGLSDELFDVVFCNHVLEHVDDFRAALKEMYRILKPTGLFICSFPMDTKVELVDEESEPLSPEERYRRYGQSDHKRVFGMKADQLLTDAGFTVEIIDGADYPEEILPIVGPADYDMNRLFCCRK